MPAASPISAFPPLPASNLTANTPSPADEQPLSSTPPSSITVGLSQKEMAPVSESTHVQETVPIVETHEIETIPEEVEGWLQKLNQAGDITLPHPITHDGDILLANTEAQVVKEKLVLPLSQTGVQLGLKSKVSESARWLAEWCVRLVKMIKDGVKYAPETTSNPSNKHI